MTQDMGAIKKIQADIEALCDKDFAKFRDWFVEKFWDVWDSEIEQDDKTGKLDFLKDDALEAKENDRLRDL